MALEAARIGAQLAAHLGLPYAFASHFAPDMLDDALHIYRRDFKPSAQLQQPYAMAGFNIFAADSQEEAENIATSMMQAVVALRTGTPGRLQPPKGMKPDDWEDREQTLFRATQFGDDVDRPLRGRRADQVDVQGGPHAHHAICSAVSARFTRTLCQ